MTMMHIAMFDAINSIEREYGRYHVSVRASQGASAEAAAAQAARSLAAHAAGEQLPDLHVLLPRHAIRAADEHPVLAGGPPTLTSARYAQDFNEVKQVGSVTSAERTGDETLMAQLFASVGTPIGFFHVWNTVAGTVAREHGLSLIETARLFAIPNVAAPRPSSQSHVCLLLYSGGAVAHLMLRARVYRIRASTLVRYHPALDLQLNGRVVVVTGWSRGLGLCPRSARRRRLDGRLPRRSQKAKAGHRRPRT